MPLGSSTAPGAPVRVSPRCIEQFSAWAAWRTPSARHGWPEPANDWRDPVASPRPHLDCPVGRVRWAPGVVKGFATAILFCLLSGVLARL